MNRSFFVLSYKQGRWACTPPKPFTDEAEARLVYDSVKLSREIRMKALISQKDKERVVLDSQGWHSDADTVTAMNKKTMTATPPGGKNV